MRSSLPHFLNFEEGIGIPLWGWGGEGRSLRIVHARAVHTPARMSFLWGLWMEAPGRVSWMLEPETCMYIGKQACTKWLRHLRFSTLTFNSTSGTTRKCQGKNRGHSGNRTTGFTGIFMQPDFSHYSIHQPVQQASPAVRHTHRAGGYSPRSSV